MLPKPALQRDRKSGPTLLGCLRLALREMTDLPWFDKPRALQRKLPAQRAQRPFVPKPSAIDHATVLPRERKSMAQRAQTPFTPKSFQIDDATSVPIDLAHRLLTAANVLGKSGQHVLVWRNDPTMLATRHSRGAKLVNADNDVRWHNAQLPVSTCPKVGDTDWVTVRDRLRSLFGSGAKVDAFQLPTQSWVGGVLQQDEVQPPPLMPQDATYTQDIDVSHMPWHGEDSLAIRDEGIRKQPSTLSIGGASREHRSVVRAACRVFHV